MEVVRTPASSGDCEGNQRVKSWGGLRAGWIPSIVHRVFPPSEWIRVLPQSVVKESGWGCGGEGDKLTECHQRYGRQRPGCPMHLRWGGLHAKHWLVRLSGYNPCSVWAQGSPLTAHLSTSLPCCGSQDWEENPWKNWRSSNVGFLINSVEWQA